MRLHAQTAVIENGFLWAPEEASWLADYVLELSDGRADRPTGPAAALHSKEDANFALDNQSTIRVRGRREAASKACLGSLFQMSWTSS